MKEAEKFQSQFAIFETFTPGLLLSKRKDFRIRKKKSGRDQKPLHPHDFPPFNASYFLYSTLNIFRFKKLPQNTITLIHTLKNIEGVGSITM